MKKLRNTIVGGNHFVYWFSWNESLQIHISPKENKNCRVTLTFTADKPTEDIQHFWRFYSIDTIKNGVKERVKVFEPKFIAELITHLSNRATVLKNSKNFIINPAWNIILEMGYSSIVPVWIQEF